MISIVVAVVIAVVTLMIVTVFVTLATGSVSAAGVVVALIVIGFIVLIQYGFLTVDVSDTMLDVKFWTTMESDLNKAADPNATTARPLIGKEVFYIGQERFIYDDAPAVCAAYDAELATQDQVEDAYAKGAEWCEYGWSAGGVALFPTQRETWEALQTELDPKKRTACGRPGVNGGYFDPTLKFGVNCYGVKPGGKGIKFPLPPPGTDTTAFDAKVKTFKDQMKDFFMAPFSRTTWSGSYGSQFAQDLGALGTSAKKAVDPATAPGTVGTKKVVVNPGSVGAPVASGSSVNASATAGKASGASSTGNSEVDIFIANDPVVKQFKSLYVKAVAGRCAVNQCPSAQGVPAVNWQTPECKELQKQLDALRREIDKSLTKPSGGWKIDGDDYEKALYCA